MAREKFQTGEDPVEVGVAIKRGFEKTIASPDKPAAIDGDYLLGVAVWWLVAFAGLWIIGVNWIAAAIVAALVCWFWPLVLLLDRSPR